MKGLRMPLDIAMTVLMPLLMAYSLNKALQNAQGGVNCF